MLVTEIDFTLEQWDQLLKLHGYKTKYTSSGLFCSPCPNCGKGIETPHFLISRKTQGMTSYNCQITSGTRLVNFFMLQYNLSFLDAREKMFEYLGITNNSKKTSKQRKKEYKRKQEQREKEMFLKYQFIKIEYGKMTSEFRKLRKILNSNFKHFKRNKPSEAQIYFHSELIQRYNFLEAKINYILHQDKDQMYKYLISEGKNTSTYFKNIEVQEEIKNILVNNFKTNFIKKINGGL